MIMRASTRRSNFSTNMAKKGNRKKRNSEEKTPKKQRIKTRAQAPAQAPARAELSETREMSEMLMRKPLSVRIIAMCLVITAVAMLGYVGVIAWGEVNRPKSIARYMPRDVRGFIEWNIDMNDDEAYAGKALMQALDTTGIICGRTCGKTFADNIANEVLDHDVTGKIDTAIDIRPWAARRAGVAMMKNGEMVWYVEAQEEKNAMAFFAKHAAEKNMKLIGGASAYRGVPIYQYEDNVGDGTGAFAKTGALAVTGALAKVDNYVMFAARADTLMRVIDAVADTATLANDTDYERIQNSVPRARLGFLYINDEALSAAEAQNASQVPGIGVPSADALKSLIQGISPSTRQSIVSLITLHGRGGRTVANLRALNDRFALEYVTHYTPQARASQQNITSQNTARTARTAYRAALATLAPQETTAFIGGADASSMTQLIENNVNMPLRDIITTQLHTWFGNALSFDEFARLTKNEWMFTRDAANTTANTQTAGTPTAPNYTLAFVMNTAAETAADTAIIRRALDAAKKQRAFFQPTITEKRLPNGTIQKRTIEGSPKTLNPVHLTHRDITIEGFEIETEGTGAFFATLDDIAVITTTKDSILKTIDRWKQDAPGFTNTKQYKDMIEPLTDSANIVAYATGATINNMPPRDDVAEKIIKSLNIGAFSLALNGFDEGIKTIMLLQPVKP